jgi:hypothetical protein
MSVRFLQGVRVFYATMLFTTMGMIACRTPSQASVLFVAQVVVIVANRDAILRSIKPGPLAREHVLRMHRVLSTGVGF